KTVPAKPVPAQRFWLWPLVTCGLLVLAAVLSGLVLGHLNVRKQPPNEIENPIGIKLVDDWKQTPNEIENSIGIKLVLIRGGKFTMGSPKGEKGRFDNEEEHDVEIRGFYFGKYEVTKGEFKKFVDAMGYKTEAEKDGKGCWGFDDAGKWTQKPEF